MAVALNKDLFPPTSLAETLFVMLQGVQQTKQPVEELVAETSGTLPLRVPTAVHEEVRCAVRDAYDKFLNEYRLQKGGVSPELKTIAKFFLDEYAKEAKCFKLPHAEQVISLAKATSESSPELMDALKNVQRTVELDLLSKYYSGASPSAIEYELSKVPELVKRFNRLQDWVSVSTSGVIPEELIAKVVGLSAGIQPGIPREMYDAAKTKLEEMNAVNDMLKTQLDNTKRDVKGTADEIKRLMAEVRSLQEGLKSSQDDAKTFEKVTVEIKDFNQIETLLNYVNLAKMDVNNNIKDETLVRSAKLNLNSLEVALKEIMTLRNDLRDQISNYTGQVATLNEKNKSLAEELEASKILNQQANVISENLKKDKEQAVKTLQEELDGALSANQALATQSEGALKSVISLRAELEAKTTSLEKLNKQITKDSTKLATIEDQNRRLVDMQKALQEGSTMRAQQLDTINKQRDELQSALEKEGLALNEKELMAKRLRESETKLSQMTEESKRADQLQSAIVSLQSQLSDKQKEVDRNADTVTNLQKQIVNLETLLQKSDEMTKLADESSAKIKTLSEQLEKTQNATLEDAASKANKIASLQHELEGVHKQAAEKTETLQKQKELTDAAQQKLSALQTQLLNAQSIAKTSSDELVLTQRKLADANAALQEDARSNESNVKQTNERVKALGDQITQLNAALQSQKVAYVTELSRREEILANANKAIEASKNRTVQLQTQLQSVEAQRASLQTQATKASELESSLRSKSIELQQTADKLKLESDRALKLQAEKEILQRSYDEALTTLVKNKQWLQTYERELSSTEKNLLGELTAFLNSRDPETVDSLTKHIDVIVRYCTTAYAWAYLNAALNNQPPDALLETTKQRFNALLIATRDKISKQFASNAERIEEVKRALATVPQTLNTFNEFLGNVYKTFGAGEPPVVSSIAQLVPALNAAFKVVAPNVLLNKNVSFASQSTLLDHMKAMDTRLNDVSNAWKRWHQQDIVLRNQNPDQMQRFHAQAFCTLKALATTNKGISGDLNVSFANCTPDLFPSDLQIRTKYKNVTEVLRSDIGTYPTLRALFPSVYAKDSVNLEQAKRYDALPRPLGHIIETISPVTFDSVIFAYALTYQIDAVETMKNAVNLLAANLKDYATWQSGSVVNDVLNKLPYPPFSFNIVF
jgi:chromosome segregation ATPase